MTSPFDAPTGDAPSGSWTHEQAAFIGSWLNTLTELTESLDAKRAPRATSVADLTRLVEPIAATFRIQHRAFLAGGNRQTDPGIKPESKQGTNRGTKRANARSPKTTPEETLEATLANAKNRLLALTTTVSHSGTYPKESGRNARMAELGRDYAALVQATAARCKSATSHLDAEVPEVVAPIIVPDAGDRRFADPEWSTSPAFDFIKQSYLLFARFVRASVRDRTGPHQRTFRRESFLVEQWLDALCPANFVATNPTVRREAARSGGASLARGLAHLSADSSDDGTLDIPTTDPDAFCVGENLASTPGQVVFRNTLIELIQYEPTTPSVFRRPLLVVPPWINRYYILDLAPNRSFIADAIDAGHSVFVISWKNPDAYDCDFSFDDYLQLGVVAAVGALRDQTGERSVNALGYCIGGTLLACACAYFAALGQAPIRATTYVASLVDFADPGCLDVFTDQVSAQHITRYIDAHGFVDASMMAAMFRTLRANDLIWRFFITNYLLGRRPPGFDLLHWNQDATRLPGPMTKFVIQTLYQQNQLIRPDSVQVSGVSLDIRTHRAPKYVFAAAEDHICPWGSVYTGARQFGGSVRFVLGASGHVAGVVNPPLPGAKTAKYGHWVRRHLDDDPEQWRNRARYREGSWWKDWQRWIARYGGKRIQPRKPGAGPLTPLSDAPGTYVHQK